MSDIPNVDTLRILWIVGAAVIGGLTLLAATITGLWRLIRWGVAQLREMFREELHSETTRAFIRTQVAEAFEGATQPLKTALTDLESRQRDHGRRLGALEQDVAALRGRALRQRIGDLEPM